MNHFKPEFLKNFRARRQALLIQNLTFNKIGHFLRFLCATHLWPVGATYYSLEWYFPSAQKCKMAEKAESVCRRPWAFWSSMSSATSTSSSRPFSSSCETQFSRMVVMASALVGCDAPCAARCASAQTRLGRACPRVCPFQKGLLTIMYQVYNRQYGSVQCCLFISSMDNGSIFV